MFRFTIRDVLWLTVLVAVVVAWWLWWFTIPPTDERVAGHIAVAGQPLAAGRVFLHLADGQIVGARVVNGRYTIERVPVGACKVSVEGIGVSAKYADENSGLTVQVRDAGNQFDLYLN